MTLKINELMPARTVPSTTSTTAKVAANESMRGRLRAEPTSALPPEPAAELIREFSWLNRPVVLSTSQMNAKPTMVAMPRARLTKKPALVADQKSM